MRVGYACTLIVCGIQDVIYPYQQCICYYNQSQYLYLPIEISTDFVTECVKHTSSRQPFIDDYHLLDFSKWLDEIVIPQINQ
jgi:hypothetical protein